MTTRSRIGACAALLVVSVSACSSGAKNQPTAATSNSATTTEHGATTTTTAGSQQRLLRVVRVTRIACPPQIDASATTTTPVGTVRALSLCPLDMGRLSSNLVTITTSDLQFSALITALSSPDEARTREACPMYADVPQIVIAETADGAYQVSIPTDACGHYQRDALTALTQARGH